MTWVDRDSLLDHLSDIVRISLDQLGLTGSYAIDVEAHDDLGHAELKLKLELGLFWRVLLGRLGPRVVRDTILRFHRLTRYRDTVLTVVVELVGKL